MSVTASVTLKSTPIAPYKNIRVGHLPCLYRILQMPDYIVMADDVMKSCHKNHLFLPFVPSVIPGGHLSTNYNIIFYINRSGIRAFPYLTDIFRFFHILMYHIFHNFIPLSFTMYSFRITITFPTEKFCQNPSPG